MVINHLLTGMILQVYATYHLLGEPETTIELIGVLHLFLRAP